MKFPPPGPYRLNSDVADSLVGGTGLRCIEGEGELISARGFSRSEMGLCPCSLSDGVKVG